MFAQIILQTSVAAPSHQELKVCGQFGDWIRNDIQYCSFQVEKISKTSWIDKPLFCCILQDCDLTYAHFARFPS